ncbi:MAG TPA: RebB family R body protein [Rhizomicrobium sp.]|jgi:hypothetical protein
MAAKSDDTAQDAPTQPETKAKPKASDALNAALLNFSAEAAKNGVSQQATDAVTQALVMILGSGPSIAAYDGLLQAQQANGLMYHNAVAHQQRTNLLGMAMTAKCVRYMMDPQSDSLTAEILAEEFKA